MAVTPLTAVTHALPGSDGGVFGSPADLAALWNPTTLAAKAAGPYDTPEAVREWWEGREEMDDIDAAASLAGYEAAGALAARLANAEAPVGLRGARRSQASRDYGPLSEVTRYEPDPEGVWVYGPFYGRFVAADGDPYIDRVLETHRDVLQDAFEEGYLGVLDDMASPRPGGGRNVIGRALGDVGAFAAGLVGGVHAGAALKRYYRRTEVRRVAIGATVGLPGTVAHAAFKGYRGTRRLRKRIRRIRLPVWARTARTGSRGR